MIYPIVMYGTPALRRRAQDIEVGSAEVKTLADDLFETMDNAQGVGLAAPQVGKSVRLFVVDDSAMREENDAKPPFRKVFINPEIVEKADLQTKMEEGCLSIPGIREDVSRPKKIKIKFFDTSWNAYEEEFEGMRGRIIQHEYDHLEGKLFIDYLSSIKKRLLKKQLSRISKGDVTAAYRIAAPVR